MMEKNSVSIHFVQSALNSIKNKDIDINNILIECGIESSLLSLENSRVSAAQFGHLWLVVARYIDDEFFGQDSHQMKVGSFAMLCNMLVHYKTLKSALICMLRFFNLLLDDFHSALVVDGQYSYIRITQKNSLNNSLSNQLEALDLSHQELTTQPRIFGHETLLILQHGIVCWLVGRRIPVLLAGFAYPKPSYSDEYKLMYSADLQFDQAYTSLKFESNYLQLLLVQSEQTVREFLKHAPTNIVLKYKNISSFSATIRKTLRETPIQDWPDFDSFAFSLNMTRSTLRRRLGEEGQPFQTIKDHLRRDMAMTLLSHSDTSMMDIATELGFAEPSAFHRAFKKWTNSTPNTYRQGVEKPKLASK